mmetsp:Transcript_86427/g.220219  ORF Transcript_86427/g.220219 Transcript_86427/m.220219 type:complete len:226 (+) Transcript_86427:343-1020(+)
MDTQLVDGTQLLQLHRLVDRRRHTVDVYDVGLFGVLLPAANRHRVSAELARAQFACRRRGLRRQQQRGVCRLKNHFVHHLHRSVATPIDHLMLRGHATTLLLVVEPDLSLQLAHKAHEHQHDRRPDGGVHIVGGRAAELLRSIDGHEDVPGLHTRECSLPSLCDRSDHNSAGAPSSKQEVPTRNIARLVHDQPPCSTGLLLSGVPLLFLRLLRGPCRLLLPQAAI